GRIVEETYANTSLENQKLIDVEIEAVHMILNGISNDIYFIMDACPNVKEMWIAIEHLQQLSAEHSEWLQDTDDEPDEQELEAHYMYIEEIQEFLQATVRNREKSRSHLKYVAH
ncbi:hypothetical protein Tco_0577748, partial [Tanacetum coccineum]